MGHPSHWGGSWWPEDGIIHIVCIYIYLVGSLVPVTVTTKKAPEKPREKVKKWRFVFQKCRLQKAICFGAALFSALHEVTYSFWKHDVVFCIDLFHQKVGK